MPRLVITQPLPQDLRNWSFEEMNCEGWDFAGRDIRGCDFRNAKLNDADFSKAIAGRSQKQIITSLLIAVGVAVAVAVVFTVVFVFAFAVSAEVAGTGRFAVAFAFVVIVVAGLAVAVAFLFAFAFSVTVAIVFSVAVAFTGVFTILRAIEAFGNGQILFGLGFSVGALVCFGFALFSAGQAIREVKNATGTNFKGADLTGVDFSHATLSNCNFEDATTRHINWSHIEGARWPINFTHARMQLSINRKGTDGFYSDLNFSDRHLAGVDLMRANLSGADLTRSNLEHAKLNFANLTNVKAGGTNFRRANLTGACIQNWTINSDTQFNDLVCDYVYLTPDRNRQNRRPLSGSFEPGDFGKLVDKFADTLDFILRRGTDLIAFTQALEQLIKDDPEARIKAIVELDRDRVLVQTTPSEGSDKVKLYEALQDTLKLQAIQQENLYLQRTIEYRDKTISMMDRLLYTSQQRPIHILQQQADTIGDTMPDKSTKYESGGDINIAKGKSAINTGTGAAAAGNISGNITLNLAALSESEDPKDKELVDLITQLRTAIEAPDCDIDNRFKQRALGYLDNLTSLAKDKPQDLLKSAKDNLDDLADIADKGSKLANFAKEHLPTFTAAIGALRLWFGV